MVLEEWCKSRHGTSTWDWIDRSQMGWLLVEMREVAEFIYGVQASPRDSQNEN